MRTRAIAMLTLALVLAAPGGQLVHAAPTGHPAADLNAKAPDDTQPFFGGAQKSPAMQERDKQVVAEAIRRAGSRERALSLILADGFARLKQGDNVGAVKYFNLAWLVDPKSPDVLWGFGAAMTQRQQFDEALILLKRANDLKPGDANLLSDFGYACVWKGASGDKTPDERAVHFDLALKLLAEAEAIAPRNPMIYSNRALVRFFQAKYAEAWREVDRAEAMAPGSVDPRFKRDLAARMPHPAR